MRKPFRCDARAPPDPRVDALGLAMITAQGAQIGHDSFCPQKSIDQAVASCSAHHLARRVDVRKPLCNTPNRDPSVPRSTVVNVAAPVRARPGVLDGSIGVSGRAGRGRESHRSASKVISPTGMPLRPHVSIYLTWLPPQKMTRCISGPTILEVWHQVASQASGPGGRKKPGQ